MDDTEREDEAEKRERLERYAREMQEAIERDILATYGPTVLNHWKHPRNLGLLDKPDGYARVQGTCGDTMEMSVRVDNDIVVASGFQTDGCGTTMVCGSAATWLAVNRTFIEALGAVTSRGILEVLGGLPEADVHCAELAAETLRRAMADYLAHKNSPWKKNYRQK
jgi:nitrogen fixation NifU-like protein